MAYVAMASDEYSMGRPGIQENARKAYELRDKVGQRERFAIDAAYRSFATGELEKAAQVYEQWERTYPRDPSPYISLSRIDADLGRWESSMMQAREATRLDPNWSAGYNNLGNACMKLNRLDEAEAAFKQAEQHNLKSEYLLENHYELAFLKGDSAQMAEVLARGLNTPGMEHVLLASQSNTEAWYGKLKSAREFTRRAVEAARHNDAEEAGAAYQTWLAQTEAEAGNRQLARAEAEAVLRLPPFGSVPARAAIALARAGVTEEPEKIAAELDRSAPLDTLTQEYWVPTIRAAVALARNNPQKAVELLRATGSTEMGELGSYPVFLRGEAYLALKDGKAAAAEFQRVIDHPGMVVSVFFGAVARLGLARAYALQGDTTKAKAAYQDLLTLWKDADPDIPIYQQAKAEYAKLQ